MNPLVYIRDVNNLSDARYCAAMGVDLIGFRLDPSKAESLSAAKCKEIAGWISGVKIVGEFGSASSEVIRDFIAIVNIDFILSESVQNVNMLAAFGKPMIIQTTAQGLKNISLSGINQYSAAYLLLISESNSIDIPETGSTTMPLILGSGITTENVNELMGDNRIAGISLTGGSEERPGYKDYDEMAEILEVIQNA